MTAEPSPHGIEGEGWAGIDLAGGGDFFVAENVLDAVALDQRGANRLDDC